MEVAAGVIAVAVVLLGVFFWQLSKGPVSFGRFTSHIETILSASSDNIDVEIEDAVLMWSQEDRTIHLSAVGVDLKDPAGLLIGHVPTVEIDVALQDLVRAKITPTRVELQGPSAMIVRRKDGSFQLGFPQNESADKPEKQRERGKVFSWLIEELNNEKKSNSPISSLERFTISDAEIEFFDETSGSLWVAPRAVVSIARGDAGLSWNMSGDVRVGNDDVRIAMMGHINPGTNWIDTSLEFSNVSLASFASKSNYFSDLADLNFPINGHARIEIDDKGELRKAELELAAEEGAFRFVEFGEEFVPVEYGAFSASYDGDRQWFDIRRLHFVAGENRATLTGSAQISFNTEEQLNFLGVGFDLSGEDLSFDLPARMKHVVAIDSLKLKGSIDIENRWINLQKLGLDIDGTLIDLEGDIFDADVTPAVVVTGTLQNLPVDKVDVLWPKNLALGARDWVTTNIKGGTINHGELKINAAPGMLADLASHPEAINFAFDVEGASVTYVKGLPQMTDASADMLLTGESFDLTLKKGRVIDVVSAPLDVSRGSTVRIEHFSIKGSPILIETTVSGNTEDILTLIDQEPLGYLKKFGADPMRFRGLGEASMSFSIPSFRHVPIDDILFTATATVKELTIPSLFADLPVDGGELALDINLEGLKGEGEISIAGAPTKVTWIENFKAGDGESSHFVLDLNFNPSTQIDWGLDTGGGLTGDVPVKLVAKGRGSNISEVKLTADMTPSEINVDSFDYSKAPGQKANAEMLVKFSENGELHLQDFKVEGDLISVEGNMSLARSGKLQEALFKRIWVDDFADVRFRADRNEQDQLQISIIGDYLNISPFLKDMMTEFGGGDPDAGMNVRLEPSPWTFEGQVNDLYLRQGVGLTDVVFEVSSDGEKFTSVELNGDFEDSGSVFASLSPDDKGKRHLTVTASDGGRIIKGITGVDQMIGGELALQMQFDDSQKSEEIEDGQSMTEYLNVYAATRAKTGQNSDLKIEDEAVMAALKSGQQRYLEVESSSTTTGYLKVDDFRIVRAPLLARLLTVGSLRGLSDTLNGEGIRFQSLRAPFSVNEEGVIGISDATAAGPALGLTMVGTFDQGTNSTDLQGTIVPSYTLNAALGNLPLLGPMLVSREGEGVFAFTYGISGPTEGPSVYVNPLSGLAPGFFRRMFQVRDQREATNVPIEQLEEKAKEQETKVQ